MKIEFIKDLEDFYKRVEGIKEFKEEIDKNVSPAPDYALHIAYLATKYSAEIAELKALVMYSVLEYERAAKQQYAQALLNSEAKSADKREAEAKADKNYNAYLSKLSEYKAMEAYIKEMSSTLDKAYHLYRSIGLEIERG